MKKNMIFCIIFLNTFLFSQNNNNIKVELYFEPFNSLGWQYFLNFDLAKKKIKAMDVKVYPIILKNGDLWSSTNGEIETSEVARIEAIIEKYPQKINDYLISRSLNMTPAGWKDAMIYAGINPVEMENYISKNKNILLKNVWTRIDLKKISSTSVFIDGEKYTNEASVLSILEFINKKLPENKKVNLYQKELAAMKGPEFKIVYSSETENWVDERLIDVFKKYFSSLNIERIEYEKLDTDKKNKIKMLPAYLIENNQTVNETLASAIKQNAFQLIGDYYVYYNRNSNLVLVDKKKENNKLELFIMSQCPFGVMAVNSIIDSIEKGNISKDIEINIHYIGDSFKSADGTISFNSLHGEDEWKEDIRQILIKKLYPDKFFNYLKERNKNYTSNEWQNAAKAVGIDVKKIEENFDTLGKKLLEEDFKYTNEKEISVSPTFIVDGNIIVVGIGQLKTIDKYKNINIQSTTSNAGCGK